MKATSPETFHFQQLAWALEFCEMDLKMRLPSHRLNLRLYEFVRRSVFWSGGDIGHEGVFHLMPEEHFVGLLTDERLFKIQGHFKDAFATLAGESSFSVRNLKRVDLSWRAILPNYRFALSVNIHEEDPIAQAQIALGLHVQHAGLTGEKIGMCERPGCGRIFIRERAPQKPTAGHTRRQYCSSACARKAAKSAYMKAHSHPKAKKGKRTG